MKRVSILGGLAISLFALPALAQETVYTTSTTTLQAGPATDYPAVGTFGAGTPVTLYGCLNGYDWCDVSYQDARGWVDGQQLVYPYENQRVPLAVYGPELSLPIVSFSFGSYWDEHYHGRPFFAERERFEHHAPPPPPPHRDRPPPLPPRGGHPDGGHPEGGPHPGEAPHPEPHPGPGPAAAHPQPQPEGHPAPPPHPQPQPAPHPQPQPQAAPHPQPQPEPHPQPQAAPHPQPAPHPAEPPRQEEHHEGQPEQPH